MFGKVGAWLQTTTGAIVLGVVLLVGGLTVKDWLWPQQVTQSTAVQGELGAGDVNPDPDAPVPTADNGNLQQLSAEQPTLAQIAAQAYEHLYVPMNRNGSAKGVPGNNTSPEALATLAYGTLGDVPADSATGQVRGFGALAADKTFSCPGGAEGELVTDTKTKNGIPVQRWACPRIDN